MLQTASLPFVRQRLIMMLKYPVPGTVKTRLIPALGADRACALHRSLVAQTQAEAQSFAIRGDTVIEARVAGAPDAAAARAWLGRSPAIRGQGEGDLGARMERAVHEAWTDGANRVVVIGGDCPRLSAEHLAAAFAALQEHDLVLGPATDGGYYLIGLRRSLPVVFRGISWSGPEVLTQTLAAARTAGASVAQLEPLADVDVPDDLPGWARTEAALATGRGRLSVVIPALNEEHNLSATLAAVAACAPHEVIVVDGGSRDRTPILAREHDAILLQTKPGRARQMNQGAAVATGEYILFLHADTRLPARYPDHVHTALGRDGVAAGAFRFAVDGDFPGRRWLERGTNWRARFRQLPYGDQGLFLRRDTFFRMGGFPEIPLMEDYAFVRRLQMSGSIALAPAAVVTSARRWRERGLIRTTLLNQAIVLGYSLGIPPERLARWYRGRRPAGSGNKSGGAALPPAE